MKMYWQSPKQLKNPYIRPYSQDKQWTFDSIPDLRAQIDPASNGAAVFAKEAA